MDTSAVFLWIIILCVILLFTMIILLIVSGVFSTVDVQVGKPPIGHVTIAYKIINYSPGQYFNIIANLLPDKRAIAIIYDVHQCVCKDLGGEKKQVVAAILAENEAAVNKEDVRKVEEEGFRMFELPNIESAALVSVAYSSIFTVTLASFNIYPKIKTFLQANRLHGHPFLEIYDGDMIHYMVPLVDQDKFYVPGIREPDENTTDATAELRNDNIAESVDSHDDDIDLVPTPPMEDLQVIPSSLDLCGLQTSLRLHPLVNDSYLMEVNPCEGNLIPNQLTKAGKVITFDSECMPEIIGSIAESNQAPAADTGDTVYRDQRVSDDDSSSSFEVIKEDSNNDENK